MKILHARAGRKGKMRQNKPRRERKHRQNRERRDNDEHLLPWFILHALTSL